MHGICGMIKNVPVSPVVNLQSTFKMSEERESIVVAWHYVGGQSASHLKYCFVTFSNVYRLTKEVRRARR